MSSRTTASDSRPHVAVIGSGFCGLATVWELGRRGVRATVLERDTGIGGLAGSFAAAPGAMRFASWGFAASFGRRLCGWREPSSSSGY